MRENIINEDLMQKLLIKLSDIFTNKINLFIDEDNNKLRVAEYLLIDSINDNLLKRNLDFINIIKPYFEREESSKNKNSENNKNNFYFDSLFYDFTLTYLTSYHINLLQTNNDINTNMNESNLNHTIISESQDYFSDNNNFSNKKTRKDYIDLIIKKFKNSNHFFIKKYILKINENSNDNTNEFLFQRALEELFVLLDIVYSISKKANEEVLQECILDIKKIIIAIITKSLNEKKLIAQYLIL